MAEELTRTGNGADGAHDPVKKASRKASRKVEEIKMDQPQVPQEFVAPVSQPVEEIAAQVQPPAEDAVETVIAEAYEVAAEAEAAVQDVAPQVQPPANGAEQNAGIRKMVKDASAQVERIPGTRQVRHAVTRVADQVGSNEMTQKAVRRMRDGVREATEQVRQGAQELEKSPLVVAAHKVLLAGVGAAVLAQEEIEDFVNRLIERGTIAESDGRRMVKDVLDQRRKQMERAGERAQEVATEVRTNLAEGPKRLADDLEQRIEGVLSRMNIPTKEEIETLTAKITALTHKVDELKKPE